MKNVRQEKLLQIISEEAIETQEQLLQRLNDLGIRSTQATISRDIKQLHLVKEPTGQGRYRYAVSVQKTKLNFADKLPRWLGKTAVKFIMWLDKHGWVPADMVATDPYYSSVTLSNLGSIKLKCGYHHLTNWGTCSLFCIIGEKKLSPFYDADGNVTMKETLDLGLTIDERLADGYYYSKSVRLLKYLLEHPEELEKPLKEEVQYE